jgi:hypothetical protein
MATAAQILNLGVAGGKNHYNLGVGFDSGHTDITPSTLYGTYSDSYYYFPKPDNSAVVMRMKVTGGRTSSNTKYPRCELREMDDANTGANDPKAAWDGNSGTHWMRGKTKVIHTTSAKPWICFAQIHNGGSDVVRLQTEGTSSSSLKLVCRHTPPGASEVVTTIQSSYTVGDIIDWRIECIGGTIKVYLGGVVKYTGNGKYTGCYFKAGLYLQSSVNNVNNTENGDTSQYAEIELKDFMTWHTGYTTPEATYFEANGGGGGGSTSPTSVNAGSDATLNTGTTFTRTAVEGGTAAITSRKWTVMAAPTTGGGGGGTTPRVAGPGGIPRPAAGPNVVLATGNTSSALTISSGGSAGNPRIYDGGGFSVGRITVTAQYVVVQNYKINAGGQYGIYVDDISNVVVQNNDIKGISASGDGDLNAFTLFGNNLDVLYNTAIDFISGDPGSSHTDFIQTWISSSHPIASSNWRIVGNDGRGVHNPSRANGVKSIHQWFMLESAGRGGNSGGSGVQNNILIAENTCLDSWNQTFKFDGATNVNITRNKLIGSSTKVMDVQGPSSNIKFFSDNQVGSQYGSVGVTVTSGAGPAIPSDIPTTTGTGGTGGTSIVGTQLGTTASLSWLPPALGAYTLRYSVTTAQGTFYDDVVVNVVTSGGGGGTPGTSTQLGKTDDGTSTTASGTDKLSASKFTSTGSGTLKRGKARVWLSASGTTGSKIAVYADNAGVPGALLAVSDEVTVTNTTEAIKDYVFSGVNQIAIANATDYWIALVWKDPDSSGSLVSFTFSRAATAGARVEQTFVYPTIPNPMGTVVSGFAGPADAWVEFDTAGTGGDSFSSPTFVGMTKDSDTSSALVLTPPAGTASGDHQLIVLGLATGTETLPGAPSGFVEAAKGSFASGGDGGDSYQAVMFVSNGSTVTGDVTITKSGSRLMQGFRLVYRGGPGFNLDSDVMTQTAIGTALPLADMFGVTGDIILQGLFGDTSGTTSNTYTTPAGYTERVNETATSTFPDRITMGIWEATRASDGTQTGSVTANRADDAAAFAIRLGRIVTAGGGGTGGTPGAAPEFVAVSSPLSGSSSTITLGSMSAENGQFQAVVILSAGAEEMTGVPTGWQLMDTIQGTGATGVAGGPFTGWVYYNTEGAGSASFTKSGTRFWHAARAVWKGQNSFGQHAVKAESAPDVSHSTPEVTTVNPNSRVVGILMQDLQLTDPGPYEPPPTWTERYDVTRSLTDEREAIAIADVVVSTAGAVSASFVGSASDEAVLFAFVLEAAPASGGGTTDPGGDGEGEIGAPTVSAGADVTLAIGENLLRSATESANGAAITQRLWSIVSGPEQVGATLSTAALFSWQFNKAGVYVIAYQATNSLGTSIDTATITVTGVGGGQLAWRRTNGWFTLQ